MSNALEDSVVLITSSDPEESSFGTGFAIHQDANTSYVLTCWHVVRDVGGEKKIRVEGSPATLEAFDKGGDLAVLRVEGVLKPLVLNVSGNKNMPFIITGAAKFSVTGGGPQKFVIRPLRGMLGERVYLKTQERQGRIEAWDLKIRDDSFGLNKGYSGSPVIDENTNTVFAIASHRKGDGKKGNALSIAGLANIWPEMPPYLLTGSHSETVEDSDYKYDVFLSYRGESSRGPWVDKYFIPLLAQRLQTALGRTPKIFIARFDPKQEIFTSNFPTLSLKKTLSLSRCLIPMWSSAYVTLSWYCYELSRMLDREQQIVQQPEPPIKLLLPVLLSAPTSLPAEAKERSSIDCSDYIVSLSTFKGTPKYDRFVEEMDHLLKEVENAIRCAPPWNREWIDEPTAAQNVTVNFPLWSNMIWEK